MRSLSVIKIFTAAMGGLALGGCLISEEPILGASNGKATPLDPGAYIMCSIDAEENTSDCERFTISHDDTGLYRLDKDGEDPIEMRLRRIGRRGYAVQLIEDNDDAYLYYYGAGNTQKFRLTMMMCGDLPDEKRAQLIEDGDLESDDEDFEICVVNTLKGLTIAAKIYHQGKVEGDIESVLQFTPAPTSRE